MNGLSKKLATSMILSQAAAYHHNVADCTYLDNKSVCWDAWCSDWDTDIDCEITNITELPSDLAQYQQLRLDAIMKWYQYQGYTIQRETQRSRNEEPKVSVLKQTLALEEFHKKAYKVSSFKNKLDDAVKPNAAPIFLTSMASRLDSQVNDIWDRKPNDTVVVFTPPSPKPRPVVVTPRRVPAPRRVPQVVPEPVAPEPPAKPALKPGQLTLDDYERLAALRNQLEELLAKQRYLSLQAKNPLLVSGDFSGNEDLMEEVNDARKRLYRLDKEIDRILKLLRQLIFLMQPKCGAAYTPKKPIIWDDEEFTQMDGKFEINWQQPGQNDPNTARWELLEYSHDNDSNWMFEQCWHQRQEFWVYHQQQGGASGGGLNITVADVVPRHNNAYKKKIFFRARAYNSCNEAGPWSDAMWFYHPKGQDQYQRLNQDEVTWQPVKDAQCQKETGERNPDTMSPENSTLFEAFRDLVPSGVVMGNMTRKEKQALADSQLW